MLNIINARYIGENKISVTFNNGKSGDADLREKDHRPVISAMRSVEIFRHFKIQHSTVVWPNEVDLAPEYLFFLVFKDDPAFQDQFRKWGYVA